VVLKNYFHRFHAGRIDVMSRSESTTGIIGGGVISGGSQPEDWERRIGQRSERLYQAQVVQRLLLAWAFPGNVVLVALAVCCFAFLAALPWVLVAAVVVPIGSIAASGRWVYRQHFKVRAIDSELRELQRMYREHELEELGADLLAAHKRYRVRVPELIEGYRTKSRRDLWKHNALQGLIIVGSIVASALTAASVSIVDVRWAAVGASLLVAVSAAFAGYAKYRERGISLQQAADSLEREYESVELRVGRYRRFGDEREAFAEFAQEVETLREEQAKRQQQLGHTAMLEISAQ
jgi:hypothetical protein